MTQSLDYILTRAVVEIISEAGLLERLGLNVPLRLKMGFDPSRPYLHLGNAVGIRKLRQFQELGHNVILIVGDWTAQIGDPSGRNETRTMLSPEQVQDNAKSYMDQFFLIMDRSRTEVRWQSEWFGAFSLTDVFQLGRQFTLANMMEHESFDKRFRSGHPITMTELLYPALQAYDSIAIRADVEFGGIDQKFNVLAGRQLQERYGQRPQEIVLVPLLIGTDGRKMGKSFGNTIDFFSEPFEKYGKIMSISDEVLIEYFRLLTDVPGSEIIDMESALKTRKVNPRDLKMRLAREIVAQFNGVDAAREAEAEFIRIFSKGEMPNDMPNFELREPMLLIDLLISTRVAASRSDARRLIAQGGVRIGEHKMDNPTFMIQPQNTVLSVGPRRFIRLMRGNP